MLAGITLINTAYPTLVDRHGIERAFQSQYCRRLNGQSAWRRTERCAKSARDLSIDLGTLKRDKESSVTSTERAAPQKLRLSRRFAIAATAVAILRSSASGTRSLLGRACIWGLVLHLACRYDQAVEQARQIFMGRTSGWRTLCWGARMNKRADWPTRSRSAKGPGRLMSGSCRS